MRIGPGHGRICPWRRVSARQHARPCSASRSPCPCLSPLLPPEPAANRPQAEIVTSRGTIRVTLYADECPQTVANFLALAAGTKEFTDAAGAKVTKPFYDGLAFHRVIKGFMLQGGCPKGDGTGGPGFAFADEINADSLGLDREKVLGVKDQPNPRCAYQMRQFGSAIVRPALVQAGIDPNNDAAADAAIPGLMPSFRQVTLKQFYEALGYRYDPKLPASHAPVVGSLAMANSGPNTNGSQFFINLADTPHLAGKHTVFGEVSAGMDVVRSIGEVAVTADANRPLVAVTITSIRPVASVR